MVSGGVVVGQGGRDNRGPLELTEADVAALSARGKRMLRNCVVVAEKDGSTHTHPVDPAKGGWPREPGRPE